MVSIQAPLILVAAAIAAVSGSAAASTPRIHPGIHRTLRAQSTVNLIVTLKDSTESVLESVKETEFATRGDRIANLVERLQAHATTSQASLHELLNSSSSTLEAAVYPSSSPLFKSKTSFWISNQVHFEAATFELVEKLSSLDSVAEVREEQILPLPEPILTPANSSNTADAIGLLATYQNQWGVAKIGAPEVWEKGHTGQGVVVGVIDTGVLGTHLALKNTFRKGGYSWYDPAKKTSAPTDEQGHGTHVTGTIVGDFGIGVAPGAKWMACKGCATADGCADSDLIACGQFMLCPTDSAGQNADCTKAPHLVSNSWGGEKGRYDYLTVVNAWIAAKIIPVFSIGNTGPACGTARSPAGDLPNVISVGSTTQGDSLSPFSSKGPATNGLRKPEITAPGSNVMSAWSTGIQAYNTISGTSMATPHISGAVALLLSARPGSTYTEVKDALFTTTERLALEPSGMTCGGRSDANNPNNAYGYGRANALAAVNKLLALTPAPTPTPAPVPKLSVTDRCNGLGELICGEFLCKWADSSATCNSWL